MNTKIDIINEHIGTRIMAPTIPPPPISSIKDRQCIKDELRNKIHEMERSFNIDFVKPTESNISSQFNINCIDHDCIINNNMIYNKLIDLESEIKNLKNMISTINYPKPTYYPTHSFNYGTSPLAQHMTLPSNFIQPSNMNANHM
jgi:hypothetical protein